MSLHFTGEAIRAALTIASKALGRYAISGVHFRPEALVATDGRRLVYLPRVTDDCGPIDDPEIEPFTVDREHLAPIAKARNVVEVQAEETNANGSARFRIARTVRGALGPFDTNIEAPKGESRFPPFESIVPTEAPNVRFVVNARYLAECLSALVSSGMTDEENDAVSVELWTRKGTAENTPDDTDRGIVLRPSTENIRRSSAYAVVMPINS